MAENMLAAQELTQSSKGTLHRNPLFSRLRSPPKMIVVPAALAGQWQREWAVSYRCPEAYKRIDAWCARHGHSEMVASLAHLHQQMRLASIAEVGRNRSARLAKAALLPMVKSHRRHRSRKLVNRERLLRRHLGYLVTIGLARSGTRWAEFVDVSESDVLDLKIQKSIGQNASDSLSDPMYRWRSPKNIQRARGEHSREQPRDGRGRFGRRAKGELFRPEAGSAAAQPPAEKKIDPLPCNPPPPQVVPAPAVEPTPVILVAGFVQSDLSNAPAPVTSLPDATIASRAKCETRARHPVPGRGEGRQQGVVVPQAAAVVHDRVSTRVAALVGLSDGVALPDPGAIARTPATRSWLLAAVPGLACDRSLQNKLLGRRVSVLAAWHAWAAGFQGSTPPGENYAGRLLHCAARYQAWFDGEPDGWNPYRAYLRRKTARGMTRRVRHPTRFA